MANIPIIYPAFGVITGLSTQFIKADGSLDPTVYQGLITINTSATTGAATLVGNTLNIPNHPIYTTALAQADTGWTDDGTQIYETTSTQNIGMGTSTPSAKAHIVATTEQLRIGYDASDYTSFLTNSTGKLTITSNGTAPGTTITSAVATGTTGGTITLTPSAGTSTSSTSGGAGGVLISNVNGSTSIANGVQGGNGSGLSVTFGAGGSSAVAGSSNNTGGIGGSFTILGLLGSGGAASNSTGTNQGGNGGSWQWTMGTGGAATTAGVTNIGGNGGGFSLTSAAGGAATGATGTNTPGAGGAIIFAVGNSGAVTSGGAGTNGSNISLTAGAATSTSGATATGGSLYCLPGAGSPSGIAGNVVLGANSVGTIRGFTSIANGLSLPIRTFTATGTITTLSTDVTILVNKTTGAATAITLTTPPTGIFQVLFIKDAKGDAGTNNITITPASGLIDGNATYVMTLNKQNLMLQWDGTNWWII